MELQKQKNKFITLIRWTKKNNQFSEIKKEKIIKFQSPSYSNYVSTSLYYLCIYLF